MEITMNRAVERIKAIKAMEFLARQINDEDIFDAWLMDGVADGHIEYGDLSVNVCDRENLCYFVEDDENFADLIDLFVHLISKTRKSGGLYIDNVCAGEKEG